MKDFPLIKYAICFVIGILLTSVIQIESTILIASIGLLFILLFFTVMLFKTKQPILNNFLAFILIIFCSFFITQIRSESFHTSLSYYHKEKDVILYGKADIIELKRDNEIVFTVISDSIHIAGNVYTSSEKILCKFRGDSLYREELYSNLLPGNSVYIEGIFLKGREQRNPGEFDYNKYLNGKGIPGILICNEDDSLKILNNESRLFESWIFNVRKFIDDKIHQIFNTQTAGLLRGLILADRSEIDYEIKTQFINSGVIHVLAVSGLHVGYILIIFIFVFGRFNVYLRTILIAAGLFTFMLITGVPPSVFRATVMAIIILIAFISNRSTNLINSIAFAAVVLLLVDPNEIYNPGFQLSFSAVLSIAIIYPIIERQLTSLKIQSRIFKNVLLFIGVSLSAQIGTLPFTLAYFGKLSVVSIFANLLVIPLIGMVIALAFTSLFVSVFSLLLASYFAAINELIVSLLFMIVSYTGNFQHSFIWIHDYSLFDSIIFYVFIAVFLYAIKDSIKLRGKLVLTALVIWNIIFLSELDDHQLLPDNKLSILMIDVGQGDAILIKFPDNQTALIDAGDLNPFFDNGERIIIPLLRHLGINKVDYGFISHLDADHYGGFLSLLYYGMIDEIFKPPPDSSDKDVRLEKFLSELNVNVNYYTREFYDIGGARLYILNDDKDNFYNTLSSNDKSGMMKLVYGDVSFLFTGDAEKKAEQYYVKKYGSFLQSDVLKVAHHGSKTSSTESFINSVQPELSLVSVGLKNKFKHPSEDVIERIKYSGSEIYRTDQSGALLFHSDGYNIKIIDWRNL